MLDADRAAPPRIRDAEPAPTDRDTLRERYHAVRKRTEELSGFLSPEDMQVQSRTECSPTKWHLAHVTWFFETFILRQAFPKRRPFHPDFPFLFNSYYEGRRATPTTAGTGPVDAAAVTRRVRLSARDRRRH